MKTFTPPLLIALLSLAFSCGVLRAQTGELNQQRVEGAFLLSFGRLPHGDEVRSPESDTTPVAELLARYRQAVADDTVARRTVAIRACEDSLGRVPTDAELAAWSAEGGTYADLMRRHVERLSKQPDEYRAVIDRAYQKVLQRQGYSIEYEYWAGFDTTPFIFLAASIENWARRNAPGLMFTNGTPSVSINSPYLTSIRLASGVAHEFRTALGHGLGDRATALEVSDHTLVAIGGQAIVSVGGIHFAAVGRESPQQVDAR